MPEFFDPVPLPCFPSHESVCQAERNVLSLLAWRRGDYETVSSTRDSSRQWEFEILSDVLSFVMCPRACMRRKVSAGRSGSPGMCVRSLPADARMKTSMDGQ